MTIVDDEPPEASQIESEDSGSDAGDDDSVPQPSKSSTAGVAEGSLENSSPPKRVRGKAIPRNVKQALDSGKMTTQMAVLTGFIDEAQAALYNEQKNRPSKPKKPKLNGEDSRKYTLVPTDQEGIYVRVEKPKKRKKQILTIDAPKSDEPEYEIRFKQPKSKKSNIQISEEQIVVERPAPKKRKMTQRELKAIETTERIQQIESAKGSAVKLTRKGQPDKRSYAQRTPAQLEAQKRMLAARAAQRQAQRDANNQEVADAAVKKVLEAGKKMGEKKKKEAPPPPPAAKPVMDLDALFR